MHAGGDWGVGASGGLIRGGVSMLNALGALKRAHTFGISGGLVAR